MECCELHDNTTAENSDKAVQNLIYICDGKRCVKTKKMCPTRSKSLRSCTYTEVDREVWQAAFSVSATHNTMEEVNSRYRRSGTSETASMTASCKSRNCLFHMFEDMGVKKGTT